METYNCPNCGTGLTDNMTFCWNCGYKCKQWQNANMQQPKEKNTNMGTAAFILGIVGLVTSCIGLGGLLGVLAIIFSAIALVKKNTNRGMITAGLTCGIIALLFYTFMFLVSLRNNGYWIYSNEAIETESYIETE